RERAASASSPECHRADGPEKGHRLSPEAPVGKTQSARPAPSSPSQLHPARAPRLLADTKVQALPPPSPQIEHRTPTPPRAADDQSAGQAGPLAAPENAPKPIREAPANRLRPNRQRQPSPATPPTPPNSQRPDAAPPAENVPQ